MADDEDDPDDDEEITCWCGVSGTYDELYNDVGIEAGCGGTGHVDCYCGGDQCVCHHHGQQLDCPGCDECPEREDDDDLDFWDT
jgi:hypothetical protein